MEIGLNKGQYFEKMDFIKANKLKKLDLIKSNKF